MQQWLSPLMPLRSWDQLGQGRRFVSEARRVSPDLAAAGFQEMRPAYAPTGAGRGDAVSGINRADSASVSGNDAAPTSSGPQPQCSTAAGTRRPGSCQPRQHCGRPDSPRFVQAAYPPPRESCVRGADRAAVDKAEDMTKNLDVQPRLGKGRLLTCARSRAVGSAWLNRWNWVPTEPLFRAF